MRRLIPALSLCACTPPPTAVGEHVVYHWDDSSFRLCGGTVDTVDRYVEAIGGYYGWSPAEIGPGFEYFWDPELALSACSWTDRLVCTIRLLNGSVVFADAPVHTHELAHTARGGSGHPSPSYPAFISEAFASRWQSAVIERTNGWLTTSDFFSPAQLRTALAADLSSDVDYQQAFSWWVALETTYGPEKMAAFITDLDGARSADDVDHATQRAFGISLAESATLVGRLPNVAIDDPACELTGLPTFSWTGTPLRLDHGGVRCEDDDIVNLDDRSALWLFALEFPETKTLVDVSVTVPPGVAPHAKGIHMVLCDGELGLSELSPLGATYAVDADDVGVRRPWWLSGRYVGGLHASIDPDGALVLPDVVFEEAQSWR